MLAFLQNNFDSTLVYHAWSSWYPYPHYSIVAKKDSSIFLFTYKSPYSLSSGRFVPGNLTEKFTQEQLLFTQTIPDTNRYFLPVYAHPSERKKVWANNNAWGIWQAEEVSQTSANCDIDDGSTDTFYLIAKGTIRVLSYYEAEFFEQCTPKNAHRQNAIRTKKEIVATFK